MGGKTRPQRGCGMLWSGDVSCQAPLSAIAGAALAAVTNPL